MKNRKTLSSAIVITFAVRDSAYEATVIRCTYGCWYGRARTSSARCCLVSRNPD